MFDDIALEFSGLVVGLGLALVALFLIFVPGIALPILMVVVSPVAAMAGIVALARRLAR